MVKSRHASQVTRQNLVARLGVGQPGTGIPSELGYLVHCTSIRVSARGLDEMQRQRDAIENDL